MTAGKRGLESVALAPQSGRERTDGVPSTQCFGFRRILRITKETSRGYGCDSRSPVSNLSSELSGQQHKAINDSSVSLGVFHSSRAV